MTNQELQTILRSAPEMTVKGRLRVMARCMGAWPVLGRFVRMLIAVIRLPEERMQYQRQLAEQTHQLKAQADALVLVHERLARYEFFVSSQIPRLASSLAELRQTQGIKEIMGAASALPASSTAAAPCPLPSKLHTANEVKDTLTI